jgi:hypothetical protein
MLLDLFRKRTKEGWLVRSIVTLFREEKIMRLLNYREHEGVVVFNA